MAQNKNNISLMCMKCICHMTAITQKRKIDDEVLIFLHFTGHIDIHELPGKKVYAISL